jgi:hypothetical protein
MKLTDGQTVHPEYQQLRRTKQPASLSMHLDLHRRD